MDNNQSMSLSAKGLFIWFLCACFFTYEFMLRTVLGTFEHPLLRDLNLSLVTFSILSSTAYQTIYGVMQIPVGILLDKFGLKRMLTTAVALCALAVIGFASAYQFQSAFIFRVLMGLGSSFGFIALLVVVYDWLPNDKTGLFIGLSQFIGTLGPMFAAGPLNAVAENGALSWRLVFWGLGVIGIVLCFLVFLFVENNRDFAGSFQILKRPVPLSEMFKSLLKQRQVWLIGLYSSAIYFAIEYLSENSGKAYLILHGYSSQTASNLITLSWLGYAIGCPLLGFISDKLERRKVVLTFAAILGIVALCIIIFAAQNFVLLCAGIVALGIGASGQSVAFATMAEQCETNYLAAGLGFNNACIVIMSSVNAPIIAALLNYFKSNQAALTIQNYQSAFLIMIFLTSLSFIFAAFLIKETFCKSTKAATRLSY